MAERAGSLRKIRTTEGSTLPTRASQPTPTARPILNRHIRRTTRRTPRTHLRRIARRIQRGPAHLSLRRESARIRTTRAAARITHRSRGEFTGGGVAAGGIHAGAGVAVFTFLDDAVAAHLEGEGYDGGVWRDETGVVQFAGGGGSLDHSTYIECRACQWEAGGEVSERKDVQMLPMEHGENCISPVEAVGLMMNCELVSHVLVVSGQQELVSLHPLIHCSKVLSDILQQG